MSLILPHPGQPTNGSDLDASIVQENITAIAQAIQSFDASQITPGSLLAAAFAASINPNTILSETTDPFVKTGCIWNIVSGLQGTMSAGVVYVNGFRVNVNSVGSHNFTASQDTYVDVDYNGNLYYLPVGNGAASPALTANSIRIAKIVTNGTAISSVTQSGVDSLFNLVYPTKPAKLALANQLQSYANTGTAGGTAYYINLGGIKLLWGTSGTKNTNTTPTSYSFTLPNGFFSSIQMVQASIVIQGSSANQTIDGNNYNTSSVSTYLTAPASATAVYSIFVIGA